MSASGPLQGVRVIEFAGIGPGPYAAMLLSDLGAEVLRIDRAGTENWPDDPTYRGRASLALDLKDPADIARCLAAIAKADVLIEGFRPGVMERLGLGPEVALERNPRLVYGRMTGWGQEGPLALAAGHDINYLALTGALAAIGPVGGPPVPPLNLAGDYGGGSLFLALGIVAALLERASSGRGQIVDAAIVDGAASLTSMFWGLLARDPRSMDKERSLLGGAAPFYRCYQCADGRFAAVGPLEPHFFRLLLEKIGADPDEFGDQFDPETWPAGAERLAAIFRSRTRDEWTALLEGSDSCFAPVLDLAEAPGHPHMAARGTFTEAYGLVQPAPAPRFSRTPGAIQGPPVKTGEGGEAMLEAWGVAL
jgi:alpha-methylacyl-CoA racemase